MDLKRTPRWLVLGLLASTSVACDFDLEKDTVGDDGFGDDGDHEECSGDEGPADEGGDEGPADEGGDEGPADEGGDEGPGDEGGDACGLGPIPPPDPGLMAGLKPNLGPDVITDCDLDGGYEVDSWRATTEGSPRLWVGGVYQTRSDHAGGFHPTGTAQVSWSIPGSNVLVLSSYEPTDWTVDVLPGGELERVIAIGYHVQNVAAPPGVAVETYASEAGDCLYSCGYALPGEGGGCEGEELVAAAEHVTGLELYAFDGCYDATTFVYAP